MHRVADDSRHLVGNHDLNAPALSIPSRRV
jgi:hypothetical protein